MTSSNVIFPSTSLLLRYQKVAWSSFRPHPCYSVTKKWLGADMTLSE
ncbi:hypothetical protein SLEP1_g39385 [Rubroshorea leprosula]|uniref:Uncharacterized protein n=1 Tax=Rubroshorea leprosula TaxID=152421 RepID=A0AAV5L0N4_9ROSI|nr:hypothetical protein SLEP1_g39385 [Rubroshorea leprosula]